MHDMLRQEYDDRFSFVRKKKFKFQETLRNYDDPEDSQDDQNIFPQKNCFSLRRRDRNDYWPQLASIRMSQRLSGKAEAHGKSTELESIEEVEYWNKKGVKKS